MSRHDVLVDGAGNPLPMNPREVRKHIQAILDRGNVEAAILRDTNGDLAVQVFGPPTRELLEVLETATDAYRTALLRAEGKIP